MNDIERILWLEGLKNAIKFNGKANDKAVLGKLMKERADLRSQANEIKIKAADIIQQINGLTSDQQKDKALALDPHALDKEEKTGPEQKILPDLPGAENGKVVMRLAPYPSGALHIGNARMIVLNDEYVKKYNGTLLLVYDDTIGTTKAQMHSENAKYVIPDAYELIREGLDWLGVKYHKEFYKSDRVEIYQEEAGKLIAKGLAYVDTCEAAVFREQYKKVGIECPCRSKPVEYHLEMYEKMKSGGVGEGEAVVRLKTGMDQKDPALRDQVIMRISDAEHPRIGTKVRLWPTLEFSWGLDDHLLGMTHIIRGMDLKKEGDIEEIIWGMYGWKGPHITLYGRLNFSDEYKLSKTAARKAIQSKEYEGWSDPRTWSMQSLRMRGIKPEALREALLDLGLSKRAIEFDRDWIYSKNKKIIDPISHRYWFVEKPEIVKIDKIPLQEFVAKPLLHPQIPDLGTRDVNIPIKDGHTAVFVPNSDLEPVITEKGKEIHPALKEGDVVRIKDMFNIKILKLGKPILAEFVSMEKESDVRKIQAVPLQENVSVRVLQPDGIVTEGYGEINLKGLAEGTIVQFERYGFVKLIDIQEKEIYCYFTST